MHIFEIVQKCLQTQNPVLDFTDCWAALSDLSSTVLFDKLKECTHVRELRIGMIGAATVKKKEARHSLLTELPAPEIREGFQFEKQRIFYEILRFKSLSNIYTLYLEYLDLQVAPTDFLTSLTHLENLSAKHCNLRGLEFINRLPNLKKLSIISNHNLNISAERINPNSIEELAVIDCELRDLGFLKAFKNLKSLVASKNYIISPAGIHHCKKLRFLNMSSNRGFKIAELGAASLYESVNFDNCDLPGISRALEFPYLKVASFANNRIEEINVDYPSTVEQIDLSGNQVKTIKNVNGLPHLRKLDLKFNSLDKITGLVQLTALESLNLSHNQLNDISDLRQLPRLKELHINHNEVPTIDIAEQFQELEKFSFGDNKITSISEKVFKRYYSQLFVLSTESIREMKNLLVASQQFEKAAFLRSLEIKMDKNETVEDFELTEYKKYVVDFFLLTNPLISPSKDTILQGYDSTISFFRNLEVSNLVPFREAKIIILGEPDAGKTSLLRYLVGQGFTETKSITRGVNIVKYKFSENNKEYQINFWDFGGQEVQQAVHQYFLTEKTLYLIVLNAVTDEQPDKYLQFLNNHAPGSPFFIISNKDDLNGVTKLKNNKLALEYEGRLVQPETRISLRQASGLQYCGGNSEIFARRKAELEQLALDIRRAFIGLPHMEEGFLKNYKEVKDMVEDIYTVQKRPYITMQDFVSVCKSKNVALGTEKSLLNHLNFIGTVRYLDEANLRGFHILNPEWLSDGIYRIITNHAFRNKKLGKVTKSDIVDILTSDTDSSFTYQDDEIDYIITMMVHFRVAYIDDARRYIYLPDLFPDDIPSSVQVKSFKSNSLHYYFAYTKEIPSYVISRIIVRLFSQVRNNDYWNKGIIVANTENPLNPCEALVEQNDRVIDMWIKGKDIPGFFAVIREALRSAHEESFTGYKEMIDLGPESVAFIDIMNYKLDGDIEYKGTTIDPLTGKLSRYRINDILGRFEPSLDNIPVKEFTINTGGGDFFGQFDSQQSNFFSQARTSSDILRVNPAAEQYKFRRLKLWKRHALLIGLASLVITLTLITLYFQSTSPFWSADRWAMIKESRVISLAVSVLVIIWNSFVLKIVYERFFDKSKEKAFWDTLRVPNHIK